MNAPRSETQSGTEDEREGEGMRVELDRIDCMDAMEWLRGLPDESVHCCVTSPPYWGLRDYKVDGQIGLERTPEEYVGKTVEIFREVRRALRKDGTLWLNLGDCYCSGNRGTWDGNRIKNPASLQNSNRAADFVAASPNRLSPPGLKPKDLVGIPWMVAFALRADGWYLRQDIIWHKPNPMPESVRDRCTKAHEYLFMLSKSGTATLWVHRDKGMENRVEHKPKPDYRWIHRDTREERTEAPQGWPDDEKVVEAWRRVNVWRGLDYYYDDAAIRKPAEERYDEGKKYRVPAGWDTAQGGHGTIHRNGRSYKQRGPSRQHAGFNDRWDAMSKEEQCSVGANKRSVWTVATQPFKEAHFATFPPALIEPCIKAGCPEGGVVMDPFAGACTTALVANRLGRHFVVCDLNPEYVAMGTTRLKADAPLFVK